MEKTKEGLCKNCNEPKEIHAKGYCRACYDGKRISTRIKLSIEATQKIKDLKIRNGWKSDNRAIAYLVHAGLRYEEYLNKKESELGVQFRR